jgi:hypothetical protein
MTFGWPLSPQVSLDAATLCLVMGLSRGATARLRRLIQIAPSTSEYVAGSFSPHFVDVTP